MIIVKEGIDASGKATLTSMTTKAIANMGVPTAQSSFPDYTNLSGQALAKLFKGDWEISDPLTRATTLQALQTVSRLENRKNIDRYVKSKKEVLVLDRYFASGLVYGKADGLPLETLVDIHSYLPQADLWLLIDIPAEESFKRRPERRDEYERRAGLMEKVSKGYLELFNNVPPGLTGSWHIIDGVGTVEEVHARVMDIVTPFVANMLING